MSLGNLLLDDFYEVEIHQAAIERTLGLDASELALLLLGAEKIVEAVALVEGEVALFVVGIDKQEAAAGLVERIDEPGLDEAEHVAAEVLALEVEADAEAANRFAGGYRLAFDRMARASSISRVKSTEPRRSSLCSIIRSKRSEASPVSTGTAAIVNAIVLFLSVKVI